MGNASAKGPPGVPRLRHRRGGSPVPEVFYHGLPQAKSTVPDRVDFDEIWRAALDENDSRREDHWFRENERQVLEAAEAARAQREAERAARERADQLAARKAQHFMKCPKCGHDMAEEDLEGVKVDRCSFCEGLFFDAGELDRVLLKKEEDRKGFFRRLVKL